MLIRDAVLRVTIALLMIAPVCDVCVAADSEQYSGRLPSNVQAALMHNAEALDRLVVDWSRRRVPAVSEEDTLQKIDMADDPFFFRPDGQRLSRRGTLLRSINRGWHRDNSGNFHEAPQLLTYDGSLVYMGSEGFVPGIRSDSLQLCVLNRSDILAKTAPEGTLFDDEYYEAVGVKEFSTGATLARLPASLLLWLIDEGAEVRRIQEAQCGGRRATEVAIAHHGVESVFCLDPTMNYAVLAREDRDSVGRLLLRADNDDFGLAEDPPIWLPRHCVIQRCTFSSVPEGEEPTPLFTEEIRAKFTREFDEHDGEFAIDYKHCPGVMVADRTLPEAAERENGAVDYFVPPDASDLDRAIDAAAGGEAFVPKRTHWILVINVVLLVIAAAAIVAVKYINRHKRSP